MWKEESRKWLDTEGGGMRYGVVSSHTTFRWQGETGQESIEVAREGGGVELERQGRSRAREGL